MTLRNERLGRLLILTERQQQGSATNNPNPNNHNIKAANMTKAVSKEGGHKPGQRGQQQGEQR